MSLLVRELGFVPYEPTWRSMREFTETRTDAMPDELWCLQHEPVFTQGQAGKAEHILEPHDVPVVQIDRGGQVTYHGPGQLVIYLLINVRRRHFGPRHLVDLIEQSIVDLLASYGIPAEGKPGAPGVYVDDAKIAALGLRIRRGCSYHGLSLNIDMDLEPFNWINPCGHEGQPVTQLKDLLPTPPEDLFDDASRKLVDILGSRL